MSAGAPVKREQSKVNPVKRISRNSIVFPFTSKSKVKVKTNN